MQSRKRGQILGVDGGRGLRRDPWSDDEPSWSIIADYVSLPRLSKHLYGPKDYYISTGSFVKVLKVRSIVRSRIRRERVPV